MINVDIEEVPQNDISVTYIDYSKGERYRLMILEL